MSSSSFRRRKVVRRDTGEIPRLLKEEDDAFVVNGYCSSSDDEWGVRWKTSATTPAVKRRKPGAAAVNAAASSNGNASYGNISNNGTNGKRRPKRCLRPFFLPRCTIVLRCHEDASEGVWVSWETSGAKDSEKPVADATPARDHKVQPRHKNSRGKHERFVAEQIQVDASLPPKIKVKRTTCAPAKRNANKMGGKAGRRGCGARPVAKSQSSPPVMVTSTPSHQDPVKIEPASPMRPKDLNACCDHFQDLLLTAETCLMLKAHAALPHGLGLPAQLSAALSGIKEFSHHPLSHSREDETKYQLRPFGIDGTGHEKPPLSPVINEHNREKVGFEENAIQPTENCATDNLADDETRITKHEPATCGAIIDFTARADGIPLASADERVEHREEEEEEEQKERDARSDEFDDLQQGEVKPRAILEHYGEDENRIHCCDEDQEDAPHLQDDVEISRHRVLTDESCHFVERETDDRAKHGAIDSSEARKDRKTQSRHSRLGLGAIRKQQKRRTTTRRRKKSRRRKRGKSVPLVGKKRQQKHVSYDNAVSACDVRSPSSSDGRDNGKSDSTTFPALDCQFCQFRGGAREQEPAAKDQEDTEIVWRKVSQKCKFQLASVTFCPQFDPGPRLPSTLDLPVDFFLKLCSDEVVEFLVSSINVHLRSILDSARGSLSNGDDVFVRACDWLQTDKSELYRFFAVCINMSIVQKPRICDYWATSPDYNYTPWFLEMFTRRRFFVLYRSILHVSRVPDRWKQNVRTFLQLVVTSFQQAYQPGKEVVVEELHGNASSSSSSSSSTWCSSRNGVLSHHEEAGKESRDPNDWEMKCFVLSDANSGYVWNMIPFFGDTTYHVDRDFACCPFCGSHAEGAEGNAKFRVPVNEQVVLELCSPLGPGHQVLASSRFTSVSLVRRLRSMGILCTGNVKQTRDLPTELLDAVLIPGDVKYYQSQDVLCSAWKDPRTAKPIIFCTSCCSAQEISSPQQPLPPPSSLSSSFAEDAERSSPHSAEDDGDDDENAVFPPFLARYKTQNKHLMEHGASAGLHARTRKDRWKKVFWWTFELFIFNAYTLYTVAHKQTNLSLLDFKKMVVEQLANRNHHVDSSTPSKTDEGLPAIRLVDTRHLICTNLRGNSGTCTFCKSTSSPTNFVCKNCPDKPYLHAQGCFAKFHELLEVN